MAIFRKLTGSVHDLAKNPLLALLASQWFRNAKIHRGMPRPLPKYAGLQDDAFGELDEKNRQHVIGVLLDRAKRLKCSISDLGWAVSPQKNAEGLHAVLVERWEVIERKIWEHKKANAG